MSRGTYHRPNNPITSPVTQVQIHHRASAGRLLRTISKTISATAQPAVMLPVTSWSFASSGGGGVGRPGSFTSPG
ncbi:MAG TPA: hypothetical protein VJ351_10460 [Streptosporangiaceae bacterium]|nr:hypothetical protein [Streptosporangiaceae bacterium]